MRLLAVGALATGLGCLPRTGFDGVEDRITTRTGLGTKDGGGFSQNEWSGCGPTVTCTVCGMYPSRLIVTGCSWDGTLSAQGVMQVWPWIVRTWAPGGSDSKFSAWSCSDDELDDIQSGIEEQPASAIPSVEAAAMTSPMRDMTPLPSNETRVSRSTGLVKPGRRKRKKHELAAPQAPAAVDKPES